MKPHVHRNLKAQTHWFIDKLGVGETEVEPFLCFFSCDIFMCLSLKACGAGIYLLAYLYSYLPIWRMVNLYTKIFTNLL